MASLGMPAYRFSVAWPRVHARGVGPGQPGRPGLLRPAGRRPAGPRDPAARHAVPLGPPVRAAAPRRLGRAAHGRALRRLRRRRRQGTRRPGACVRHPQRALVLCLPGPCVRCARAGDCRHARGVRRRSPPQPRARSGGDGAAVGDPGGDRDLGQPQPGPGLSRRPTPTRTARRQRTSTTSPTASSSSRCCAAATPRNCWSRRSSWPTGRWCATAILPSSTSRSMRSGSTTTRPAGSVVPRIGRPTPTTPPPAAGCATRVRGDAPAAPLARHRPRLVGTAAGPVHRDGVADRAERDRSTC